MKVTAEQVLAFVRRDGPVTAPAVFLTIEDASDLDSPEEFESYYGNQLNQTWERTAEDKLGDWGLPAKWIPKFMLALLDREISGSTDYLVNRLYIRDTCNIKYFPIARKGQSTWPSFLKDHAGFGENEFLRRCLSSARHDAILEVHGHALCQDKLIVILGRRDAWKAFLDTKIFAKEKIVSLEGAIRDAGGHFVGELYGTERGEFRYCYFKMFGHNVSDAGMLRVAERVRARAAHLIERIERPR
jgi:hypothetical protein